MSEKFFAFLAYFIIRSHRVILVFALALTAAAIVLISQLQMNTSLDSLLPSKDPIARELLSDLQDAGAEDVLVAMIRVASPELLDDGKLVVDEFVQRMASVPSIESLDARVTARQQKFFTDVLMPNAGLFLSDQGRYDLLQLLSDTGIHRQIQENKRLLLLPMHGGAGELLVRDPLGLRALWLSRWLGGQSFGALEISDGYLVDKEHRHLLVFIRPSVSARNIAYTKRLMAAAHSAAESAIATWRQAQPANRESPAITFAGGYPIAFADEALTRKDLQNTLIVSFVGISLLFTLVFRNPRILFLILVPLAMGITWTFGSLRLIFGHISILTGTFGGVLLGLGTDFAIYLLNLYLAAYHTEDHSTALRLALQKSGRGILVGGLTSAAGFLTLGTSSFRGFRELGIITGLGLMFCLLAMVVVLPALLVWQHQQGWSFRQVRPIPNFGLDRLFAMVQRRPRWVIGSWVVILACLTVASFGVSFDDDLRSLRPQQTGVQAAQKQLESLLGGASGYLLLVMEGENDTELLDRALHLNSALERLQAEGQLAHYRSILSYLPAPESQRHSLAFFAEHAADLDPRRIETTFRRELQDNGFRYLPEYDSYLQWLRTLLRPHGELHPENFAQAGLSMLIDPFLGKRNPSHKLLTYIYPRTGLWLGSDLERLTADIQQATVSSGLATNQWRLGGFPVLTQYLKQQVWLDLGNTVLLASLAIVFLVVAAFRRPLPAVLATIPLVAALLTMLGAMALLSLRFNYINFIVLPMMIGICINDGALMINHWKQEPDLPLTIMLSQIGRAVLLTSLTTLMGFGSLVCSHYPGLQSIGWLAGLGIFAELSASLILLPAILAWMEQNAVLDRFGRAPSVSPPPSALVSSQDPVQKP